MYQFRWGTQADLPWMSQAAALGAWESLSPEERATVPPATVAQVARQQLYEALHSGMGAAIVAQDGAQPVGFLSMALGPDATTEEVHGLLLSVWVAPEHRRRGVARALRQLAEGVFSHMGMRKVKIWSGTHNEPAINLARQGGYVPEGLIGMKAL